MLHLLTYSLTSHINILEPYGSQLWPNTVWSLSTGTVIGITYTELPGRCTNSFTSKLSLG